MWLDFSVLWRPGAVRSLPAQRQWSAGLGDCVARWRTLELQQPTQWAQMSLGCYVRSLVVNRDLTANGRRFGDAVDQGPFAGREVDGVKWTVRMGRQQDHHGD